MYGSPHEVDYAATLHGRYDRGPLPDDSDLAARVVASLMETSEMAWVRHKMELDAIAQEEEEALAGAQPSGPVRHSHIPDDASGAGRWQDEVEEEGQEPSGLAEHQIDQARRFRDPSRHVRHRDFSREPSGFGGPSHSEDEEDEGDEPIRRQSEFGSVESSPLDHRGHPMRTRHSKERSRFHYRGPNPDSGKPITVDQFQGNVPQGMPQQGSIIGSNRESILTSVKNGSMTIAEGKAAIAQLAKYRRDRAEFDAAVQRQFGPAASNIDMSVDQTVRQSEPIEWGEVEDLDAQFAQKAMNMDEQARREAEAAHGQRRRYHKRLREQSKQYVAPDWIVGQTVISNKAAALIAAKEAIRLGGDQAYERVITSMSKVPA
jgi:hypothetical protein